MGGTVLKEGTPLYNFLSGIFPNAPELMKGLGAGMIIVGAFSWFFGYLGGLPQLSMRFMAITDARQAKKARNIGIVWTIIAYIGALMIGWLGIALFGPNTLADQETVLPEVLTTVFPPIIAGILITGVLAAIISTANSLLILSATELSENIIKPARGKGLDTKKSLLQSRIVTALLSVIALLLAYFSPSDLIYTIVGYVWAGIGCTFSVVILLTLFWKKYHGRAVLVTIITGLVFTIIWVQTGMDKIITARFLTFVVALIVAVLGTYFIPPKKV